MLFWQLPLSTSVRASTAVIYYQRQSNGPKSTHKLNKIQINNFPIFHLTDRRSPLKISTRGGKSMAASISHALSRPSSLSPISQSRKTLALSSSNSLIFPRNPSSRLAVASMSIEAPQRSPKPSLLDQKEEASLFLHFVKYHGLGNDFIMVSDPFYVLSRSLFDSIAWF